MPHFQRLAILLVTLAPLALAQKEIPMPTAKGNISVIFDRFERVGTSTIVSSTEMVRLRATLRNETPFTFKSVQFAVNGFDAGGNNLNLCGPSSLTKGACSFHLFNSIDPGATVTVGDPGDFAVINTSAKVDRAEWKVLEAAYYIKYDIHAAPIANAKFSITPVFSVKGIALDFRNKSSDVIEVAWDQSVYIDEEANSCRLIRGNVNLAEKDRPQPNTVIPPGAKLQETVFPIDRIKQLDGKWTQSPIFPELAYIFDPEYFRALQGKAKWLETAYFADTKDFTGKEVRLFLRLLINDQKQNVTIPFKIMKMIQ